MIPETNSRYSVFDILRDELEVILKGEEWPPPEGREVALNLGWVPAKHHHYLGVEMSCGVSAQPDETPCLSAGTLGCLPRARRDQGLQET